MNNSSAKEINSGRVIKAGNRQTASAAFGNLLKNQIWQAQEEAREILRWSRQTAEDTITQAEQAAEEIRREAYDAGRAEAEREWIDNLLLIKEQRRQNLASIERDVLQLSVKIAEKIIGKELQLNPEIRAEIVFNALRQVRQQERLTVRVSQEDLALVEQMRQRIDSYGRHRDIDFVADRAVRAGGCIVESQSGTTDARVEIQLRILENALLSRGNDER